MISFATNDLLKSAKRLMRQAKESNFYDQVIIITPDNLSKENKDKINFFIKKGKKRGYGYWFWKPLILLDLFKKINNEEIVHYLDIGFHINKMSSQRYKEYLNIINKRDKWLLAFQYNKLDNYFTSEVNFPVREEYKYTKGDVFQYFNCINNKKITHTAQFSAGNFMLKKNKKSEEFLLNWKDVFEKKFELIDDTESVVRNFPDFVENRHDQSIFSILCKKNQIKSLSAYEFDWAKKKDQRTWEHNLNCPFLAKRDLEYNIFKRFFNRQVKNYRRKKRMWFKD